MNPPKRRRRTRRDDGSATVEAAIITPVLLLFLMLCLAAGRIMLSGQNVDDAAQDAARAASMAKTPGQAETAAQSAANSDMAGATLGLHCTPTVSIPSLRIPTQAGQSGYVTVKVSCTVHFSDLSGLNLGSKTMTSTFTSYADTYTQR